jgi:maleate cis-trans isomerase
MLEAYELEKPAPTGNDFTITATTALVTTSAFAAAEARMAEQLVEELEGAECMELKALPSANSTHRAELCCVQLPSDFVLEHEGPLLVKMFPGVTLRMVKMAYDPNEAICEATYFKALESGHIRNAAAHLAFMRCVGVTTVVGVACTSMSFILGADAIRKELMTGFPAARTMDMAEAQAEAVKALGASRIALLTPYVEEVYMVNAAMLTESAGVEVVSHHTMNLAKDEQTTAVEPEEIKRLALEINCDAAQIVVIGCSAFRACQPGFISDLERQLGKPVVTSTQAYLWWMLRTAGMKDQVGGYGRLFSHC